MGQRGFSERQDHASPSGRAIRRERGLNQDLRTPQQVQLDAQFPPADPADFTLLYDKPGQAPPMDAVQKQNLQKFDTTARTWLSHAGFAREHGNSLVNAITRVVETTKEMTEGEIRGYAETEYSKLIAAYGSESALQSKMQLAAKMIHELDTKQPGLKRLLQTRGIGDSALVVSQLIQQAERWEIRKGRS
jgi:hypothetical protein